MQYQGFRCTDWRWWHVDGVDCATWWARGRSVKKMISALHPGWQGQKGQRQEGGRQQDLLTELQFSVWTLTVRKACSETRWELDHRGQTCQAKGLWLLCYTDGETSDSFNRKDNVIRWMPVDHCDSCVQRNWMWLVGKRPPHKVTEHNQTWN